MRISSQQMKIICKEPSNEIPKESKLGARGGHYLRLHQHSHVKGLCFSVLRRVLVEKVPTTDNAVQKSREFELGIRILSERRMITSILGKT